MPQMINDYSQIEQEFIRANDFNNTKVLLKYSFRKTKQNIVYHGFLYVTRIIKLARLSTIRGT